MDGIRIRWAVPDDLPAVRDVFRRSALTHEGDRAVLLANPEVLVLPADGVDQGRTRVAVTADGTIVGFAIELPRDSMTLELEDLFVDPDWMRRRIGTRLVGDLIERARRAGVRRIRVTANPANQPADAFYRGIGFMHVRDVETRFGPASHIELIVADRDI